MDIVVGLENGSINKCSSIEPIGQTLYVDLFSTQRQPLTIRQELWDTLVY